MRFFTGLISNMAVESFSDEDGQNAVVKRKVYRIYAAFYSLSWR
ncbi:hypothetical protein P262_01058 [Cronobacter malonaticus]|uniref:Uncharacterized protein n=3 Tax=Cronobacter TaxID=413496 RepID=A7MR63_CROS8|nr:hypothetical protein ESA_00440 [Cronobacter sakazakii ATCC BAA-894]AHB69114.1 hypothetical protein P262_01058 [Cronobacter malonaticus]CBA33492.1 unknown protein [Cronobacter turicensis z3032]